ncbi:MAG: hypothetical protein ABIN58_09100, partial [candidate division WOR-3 bacterium]
DLQQNGSEHRKESLKADIKGGYRKPGEVKEEGAFPKKGAYFTWRGLRPQPNLHYGRRPRAFSLQRSASEHSRKSA